MVNETSVFAQVLVVFKLFIVFKRSVVKLHGAGQLGREYLSADFVCVLVCLVMSTREGDARSNLCECKCMVVGRDYIIGRESGKRSS